MYLKLIDACLNKVAILRGDNSKYSTVFYFNFGWSLFYDLQSLCPYYKSANHYQVSTETQLKFIAKNNLSSFYVP